MTSAIVAENLSFRWPRSERFVVRDISLQIAVGERVALLGRSGVGKTTLCKVLARLLAPTNGRVLFPEAGGGRQLVDIAFQENTLLPWLSVLDNVLFAHQGGAAERKQLLVKAETVLEAVGLDEIGHLLPRQLSGGMRQRVSVARAIFRQCRLTILDEPFSALDLITREALYALVRQTSGQNSIAYLIVTHLPEDAFQACDRSLILGNGGALLTDLPHTAFGSFDEYRRAVLVALER